MKKKSTTSAHFYSLLILFAIGMMSVSTVQASNDQFLTVQEEAPVHWTHAQTENGIAISFAKKTINGETFLAIKFENNNAQPTVFIWSLMHNSETVVITEDEMAESRIHLETAENFVYNGTYLVLMDEQETFENFHVSIQPTK